MKLRAPVSESLSRLHRDQLQKFAQYLISELPQQVRSQYTQDVFDHAKTINVTNNNILYIYMYYRYLNLSDKLFMYILSNL